MDRTRRSFLKGLAYAGATAAASAVPAAASEQPQGARTTRWGCCTTPPAASAARPAWWPVTKPTTCRRTTATTSLHDAPQALNDRTKNIIKLYKEEGRRSYMKQQCMHCIDPACVGACMIGALQKREYGIVTWECEPLHRLPLLPGGLPLQHAQVRVGKHQPADHQVRAVQPPASPRARSRPAARSARARR